MNQNPLRRNRNLYLINLQPQVYSKQNHQLRQTKLRRKLKRSKSMKLLPNQKNQRKKLMNSLKAQIHLLQMQVHQILSLQKLHKNQLWICSQNLLKKTQKRNLHFSTLQNFLQLFNQQLLSPCFKSRRLNKKVRLHLEVKWI